MCMSLRCYFGVISSMGTKVHRKSYAPLCYTVNDLNENGNSDSWPHNYKARNLTSSCYYDHFLQRRTTYGHSESDKEELKQAMLKHEVIFKNQVHELHRLYGIQKDFMNELRRNNSQILQRPEGASQSSPFSYQILSEDVQKMWTFHQNQLARSSCSSSPTSPFYKMQSPVNFSEESNGCVSPVPIQKKRSLMNLESLQSTSKKCPIEKIDLQLSADEYIASEEMRHIEESYPLKRYCRVTSEGERNDEYPSSRGDASNSESGAKCKRKLADFHVEYAATAAPFNFMAPTLCNRQSQGKNFCSNQNSVFVGLSMEYLHGTWRGRDKGKNVNVQCVENKDNCKEPEAHVYQPDSCPGSSSGSPQTKPKRIPCVDLSALLNKYPKLSSRSLSFEEQKWCSTINSRLVPSFESAKFPYNGIFPELQLDSNSSQNHVRSTGIDFNRCDNSATSEDGEYTAKHIGGSNCEDVKSAKDMDLNLDPPSEVENEDLSSEPPMLRVKVRPPCVDGNTKGKEAMKQMRLDILHGFGQHSTCTAGTGVPDGTSTQSLAPTRAIDSDFQMLGFPVVNKLRASKDQPFLSTFSNSHLCPSEAVEAQCRVKAGKFHTDFVFDVAKSNLSKKLPTCNLALGKALGELNSCRNHISSISCTKGKRTKSKTRKIHERDLVVNVDPVYLDGVFTRKDSSRDHPEKGVWSLQTGKNTPQELVKVAAEVIFDISTSATKDYLESETCPSLETSLRNPLHWFAELATSITDDCGSQGCVDDDKLSDGMDYFELMTLELTETKPDEYFSKSLMTEYPEEVTDCSLLTTQRARGNGRRGRQPKNFQRDVLPSFSSLTKHEISEDLEMLEGLMKSMGHSWQIGLARRNAARTGGARGKGRLRSSDKILTARTL